MKKVVVLFSVVLFSTMAFALNASKPADDPCQPGREAFAQLQDEDLVVQELLTLADSLNKMNDIEALPAAVCYATYHANGQTLLDFIRTHKNDYRDVVTKQLTTFAARIDSLSQTKQDDVCQPGRTMFEMADEEDAIIYEVLKLADALEPISDPNALPLATCYATYRVNEQSLTDFIRTHKNNYRNVVTKQLTSFVNRVEKLTR